MKIARWLDHSTGETPHQEGKGHGRRLQTFEHLLDEIGRQQRQPQYAADVGLIDLLGRGDLGDGRVAAVLQHFAPAERPGDRLDHGVVDVAA